jgi:hypothetical protein
MTEEQAILERSKDRVAEIMGNAVLAGVPAEITKPRRTRSDAGTKRSKPEVEKTAARSAGFLTIEQVAHLEKLRENWFQAVEANSKAEDRMLDADRAYHEYLDELTIK